MTEYIKRDDLLQNISETVIFTVREGTPLPNAEMRGANKVIDRIKSAKAADVVEVVRCKDCKHYRPQVKSSQWENKTNYCCRTAVIKVKPNDFCSFGTKMDGKGEGE